MKLFLSYLREKRRTFVLCGLFALIFVGAFALYRLPIAALLYPAALCLLLGCVALVLDYLRVRQRHAILSGLRARTETLIDTLPEPDGIAEADYRMLVQSLCEETAALRAADQAKYRDMTDYYTVWAHQIKTPISAMKLSLQSEDSPISRRLSAELLRIEQYVEMVLAFLRLDSDSSDYVFRERELDGIIRQAVRKFAPEFIGRKLLLDYVPVDWRLVTDEKWLSFVIEQILSNALKYTRTGGIRIAMDTPGILSISDTGIGIAPEDLPRIFEKGYTGFNGRTDQSASGIGLYLCRRICRELGIDISARSEVGVGTEILLDLSQYPIKAE